MRGWAIVAAMLVAGTGIAAQSTRVATRVTVVLIGNGLSVGKRTATFRTTNKADAIALVTPALGWPTAQGSHGDCGQGHVIGYAKFRGGFELSFIKGRLSGWTADTPMPRTSRGIGVGATLAALRKAYPDVEADPGDEANGGLGPSFQREGGPNGWLDGTRAASKVTGLFAGATCLAGI